MTRQEFTQSLRDLGVKDGDILYIRAAVGALGKLADVYDVVIGGLSDAVGPNGTLMAPAFTKIQKIFDKSQVVFDEKAVPYSGAVSKLFLKHPKALRSKHPSHSFVAFGPNAKELLEGHGPEASCFHPIKKLAELDGKMILLGCNNDSPGFSTVHVAQFDLGLSQRHLVRHLQKSYVRESGQVRKWKPIESPGCSDSFDKFYPGYIRDANLITGKVGKAFALLIPSTKIALERDTTILKNKPTFVDCGRWACLTCGFRSYQLWRLPVTFVAYAWKILRRSA